MFIDENAQYINLKKSKPIYVFRSFVYKDILDTSHFVRLFTCR